MASFNRHNPSSSSPDPTSRGAGVCSRRCVLFLVVLTPRWVATGFAPCPTHGVVLISRGANARAGVRRWRVAPLEGLRFWRGRGPGDPGATSPTESLKRQLRDAEFRAAAAMRERDAATGRAGDSSLAFLLLLCVVCAFPKSSCACSWVDGWGYVSRFKF
jgi:hypothetical protein